MSEYCLRWNNHRPNLVTVFSELLTSEVLVDVTLATDGHYIHAHKLVLSACSVYFKDLFGANPCKHPIVILKDIRIDDLKTVIDFIYRGEVNVAQDRLQDVLRTAESLRIKGLAENPRSYDEMSSHSARFMGSQTSRQRSSMTDSREQSLSVEGEEEGEPITPPSNKKRKITSSHDSSESVQEEGEGDERGGGGREVKDEPPDDAEEGRPSREGSEQDSASIGGSQEGVGGDDTTTTTTTTTTTPGTSSNDPSLPAHAQGRGKRGVLQRQQGIIRESGSGGSAASVASVTSVASGVEEAGGKGGVGAGVEVKGEGGGGLSGAGSVAELIVPDTVVVSGGTVTLSTAPAALLQVPALVVGPRDSLPKQHSHPTPLLTPTPVVTKQQSHPEGRGPPTHAGHSAITKQRSQPTVVTHAPSLPPLERLPVSPNSAGAAAPSSQHLQVIPYPVLLKQRSAGAAAPVQASSLRPIQPKPSASAEAALDLPPKKDVPLIRLTPSEDSGGGGGGGGSGGGGYGGVTGPPRLPRAASEEPALTRHPVEHSADLLAPGPSVLVQSVSQDSGLEAGPPVSAPPRLGATPLAALTVTGTPMRSASSPGHCPVLRGGPALGCNFCWNSTDPQGRVLRRKTKYHCPECRTNLCIVPCFHEYHKQIERVQESDKQISKILTKTGSI
ncbi:zinc finger protein chinmo-like [Scylla paramamosain]|uniref:zinc finger protein chinmo-like n=1 Tax=Scylla paramamosain TaxID=85552 RepID=UPI003082721C